MKIHEFLSSHARGQGKTEALANMVKNIGGTIFVRNDGEAKRVNRLYGVNAISIDVPEESLMGRHLGPSFVDPDACYFLVKRYTRPLENRIEKLQDKYEKLQDKYEKLQDKYEKLQDKYEKAVEAIKEASKYHNKDDINGEAGYICWKFLKSIEGEERGC